MNIDSFKVIETLAMVIALLFSLIMHENAHGIAAYLMGDSTAKDAGRISLNPVSHLSLYGTISLLIFKFGWAKPVPVNPYNYKNKRIGNLVVSLAGITCNLILALLSTVVLKFIFRINNDSSIFYFIVYLFLYLQMYNVFLAVFNLIPIPPLDGSKVIYTFLPEKWVYFLSKNEYYFNIVLIILIFVGIVSPLVTSLSEKILNFLNFALQVGY